MCLVDSRLQLSTTWCSIFNSQVWSLKTEDQSSLVQLSMSTKQRCSYCNKLFNNVKRHLACNYECNKRKRAAYDALSSSSDESERRSAVQSAPKGVPSPLVVNSLINQYEQSSEGQELPPVAQSAGGQRFAQDVQSLLHLLADPVLSASQNSVHSDLDSLDDEDEVDQLTTVALTSTPLFSQRELGIYELAMKLPRGDGTRMLSLFAEGTDDSNSLTFRSMGELYNYLDNGVGEVRGALLHEWLIYCGENLVA